MPYVLRKRDDGYYMFIGEMYLDGIMRGEAPNIDDPMDLFTDIELV